MIIAFTDARVPGIQSRRQKWGEMGGADVRIDACSVFLQVSSQDEDSFTVLRNGEFLG